MTLYTIAWTEEAHHEVDIDADGPDEALEEFWVAYYAGGADFFDSIVETDGPQDIVVSSKTAIVLNPKRTP